MKKSENCFKEITNTNNMNLDSNKLNNLSSSKLIVSAAAAGKNYRENTLIKINSFGSISDSFPSSTCSTDSQKSIPEEDECSQIKRQRFENTLQGIEFDSQKVFNTNKSDSQSSGSSGCNQQDKLNSSNDSDLSFQNMDLNFLEQDNSFYGLPIKVKELLKQLRNISCLYDWQHELLTIMQQKYQTAVKNLHNNINQDLCTNLLYLSPTSGGKTLVAELLILHCLLVKRKNCIFVMPFVSIVQEKVQLISDFAEALNFYVEEYAGLKGTVPPIKRQMKKKCTLYICTIEKAHSLINSLIETGRLRDEIGLVCADELHMIGEDGRGAIYEMILSKIKYCSETMSEKPTKDNKKVFLTRFYFNCLIFCLKASLIILTIKLFYS